MNLTDEQIATLRIVEQRVQTTKAEYDDARADRESTIREIAGMGISYRKIAHMVSLSHQRVAQIVGVPDDRLRIEQTIEAYCPACEAEPGDPCEGKGFASFHGERHDRRMAIHEGEVDDVVEGEPGYVSHVG